MERAEGLLDRRRYEIRGIVIKAQAIGRELSEETLEIIRYQHSQKYGEGWELDSVHPGAIITEPQGSSFQDGHMVIFKRRRQLRDE